MTDRPGSSTRPATLLPGVAGLFSSTTLAFLRFASMAALVAGTAASSHAARTDQRVATGVLIGCVLVAYVCWAVSRRVGKATTALVALLALAVAGGAVGALSSLGVAFVAVIGIVGADLLPDRTAVGLVVVALASLAVSLGFVQGDFVLVGWAALAGAGGLLAGFNRRQYRLRAEQSELLLAEREHTAAEAAHAAALEERNRIAREVHDVLAHSLSALAVQLDTIDALLGDGDVTRAREAAATSRRLAVEGLDETRRAVRALRGAPLELVEQLRSLAAAGDASFQAVGEEQLLAPEAALAVYRVAQEALTNVRKHAPGARAAVSIAFAPDHVSLEVVDSYSNGSSPPSQPVGPPGYGLTGMRERLQLLGGSVEAGPLAGDNGAGSNGITSGWRVAVELPLRAAPPDGVREPVR